MRREKLKLFSEVAYILGLLLLALGTAMVEKTDFGLSMVVAPAYLLNLKLSNYWTFMSFGMAEYMLQGVLVLLTIIVLRKFRPHFLFSFVTAVIYGFILDGCMWLIAPIPDSTMPMRIILFVIGVPVTTCGVAFMFHTYISAEAYELFVKEISLGFNLNMGRCKIVFDLGCLVVSVIMTFAFFGELQGIGVGTLICAFLNGLLVGLFGRFMDKRMIFTDRFKLRKYFE